MSSRNSHSGADDTIIQAEQQTFLTSCVSSPFILCSLSPSTCISLPPPMYTTLFVLKFKSILTVDRAERISRGCFCYGRCDWSARSRKAGCPGAGKCLLISSSHNLEKPERCRLHSCCVRLYHGTLRGSRLLRVPCGFVRLRRALRLPLRRKESSSMFLVVVSSSLFPLSFGTYFSRECTGVNY